MEQVGRHSQHKVLLPAWLAASHGDGRALNILHLQGHVRVKFLCKKKSASAKTLLVMLLFTGKHPNFGLPIKKSKWMTRTAHNSPCGPSSLPFFTASTERRWMRGLILMKTTCSVFDSSDFIILLSRSVSS